MPYKNAIKIVENLMTERARADVNLPFEQINKRVVVRFHKFLYEQISIDQGVNVNRHLVKVLKSLIKAGKKFEWPLMMARLMGVCNPPMHQTDIEITLQCHYYF